MVWAAGELKAGGVIIRQTETKVVKNLVSASLAPVKATVC